MDALITSLIPQQNYEAIGQQIASILAIELPNQKTLGSGLPDVKIFSESMQFTDKTDMPCINVCFFNGEYDRKTTRSTHGEYLFTIDVYANGKGDDNSPGDLKASNMMKRLMGIIRAILDDNKYSQLGFAPPVPIESIMVKKIGAMPQPNTDDTLSSVYGRLLLMVRCVEDMSLVTGVICNQQDTTVKINNTEDGYQFINTAA